MTISLTENSMAQNKLLTNKSDLRQQVEMAVGTMPVIDVHSHLFPPKFGSLCLYGIDELLTYHYLIAETFRSTNLSPAHFWQMTKTDRADLIWKTLFVENTPFSEATRGIVSILDA